MVRLAMTTSAPCSANSFAVAAPIPVPPPVTMATRPAKCSLSIILENLGQRAKHGTVGSPPGGFAAAGEGSAWSRAATGSYRVQGSDVRAGGLVDE